MSGPTTYYVIDPPVGSGGLATGAPLCPRFTAPTLAAAQQVAYIISSALQRAVQLVGTGLVPPWTLILPGPCNAALTSVPSGIG